MFRTFLVAVGGSAAAFMLCSWPNLPASPKLMSQNQHNLSVSTGLWQMWPQKIKRTAATKILQYILISRQWVDCLVLAKRLNHVNTNWTRIIAHRNISYHVLVDFRKKNTIVTLFDDNPKCSTTFSFPRQLIHNSPASNGWDLLRPRANHRPH